MLSSPPFGLFFSLLSAGTQVLKVHWSVTKFFSWLPPSGWNSKKSLLCNIEGDIQGGQRWLGAISSRTFEVWICGTLNLLLQSCIIFFYLKAIKHTLLIFQSATCSWTKMLAGNIMWEVFASKTLTLEKSHRGWHMLMSNWFLNVQASLAPTPVSPDLVDMVADMEVDKVADMVADMTTDKKNWPTWSWTWWPTWR